MPIYEYLCARCHLLLNFFSSRIDPSDAPVCPHCGSATTRRPARFAMISRSKASAEADEAGGGDDDIFAGLDQDRLEQVMESMGDELERMGDDEDPRRLASVFRRFGEASGLELGPRMEEMLRRLERGENPEAIEAELGGEDGEGELGDDDLSEWIRLKKAVARRRGRPGVDETLYFM